MFNLAHARAHGNARRPQMEIATNRLVHFGRSFEMCTHADNINQPTNNNNNYDLQICNQNNSHEIATTTTTKLQVDLIDEIQNSSCKEKVEIELEKRAECSQNQVNGSNKNLTSELDSRPPMQQLQKLQKLQQLASIAVKKLPADKHSSLQTKLQQQQLQLQLQQPKSMQKSSNQENTTMQKPTTTNIENEQQIKVNSNRQQLQQQQETTNATTTTTGEFAT